MRRGFLCVLSFLMPYLGIGLGGLLGLAMGGLVFTEPCDGFGNCGIPDLGPFLIFGLVGAVLGCVLGVFAGERLWPPDPKTKTYGLKFKKE